MFDSTLLETLNDMQVVDLRGDSGFMSRPIRLRERTAEIGGLQRLAHVFAQRPEMILQELVEVSMDISAADSAGITLEESVTGGESQFRWIATAGSYSGFLGAVLPRFYSPCGTCLDRGQPQLFRVPKTYLDMIGVQAPPVTDGILIPWEVDEIRGTLWVLAHGAFRQFDREDYLILESLSDFAAIAMRHEQRQERSIKLAKGAAAAAMANELAHQINNPLQGLMQTLFLAGQGGIDAEVLARKALEDVTRLSQLVNKLLVLPKE